MAPKVKITKEDIVNIAVEIVRKNGTEGINARSIATMLNCSTQPVFSNFASMEELKYAVLEKANELYQEYIKREVESGEYPVYKASGMAYIRFAKEEKELFKLLFMRDRSDEEIPENTSVDEKMEAIVRKNMGLNETEARLFHLEMWAYVHGIATMFATCFINLDWQLVSKMLTDSYLGMRKQYGVE